ncbi:MAG: BofC C-terminal domain-containing protein, partial [Nesterenkonia sp.]
GQPLKPVRHTYSEMLGERSGDQQSPESDAESAAEPKKPKEDEEDEDFELELDDEDLGAITAARRRRAWFLPTFVALLVVLIALVTFLGYVWTQTQYYVGDDDGEVAIFTGVSQSLGPITLSEVDEHVGIDTEDLPRYDRNRVSSGIFAEDRAHAEQIVELLESSAGGDQQ